MPKAIVIREYGGSDVLKVEDVSVESPGPNEILIRQTAIGVHFHDCLLYTSPSPRDS